MEIWSWTPKNIGSGGELKGGFRSKVSADYPGAKRHNGKTPKGVEYDYFGIDCNSVAGTLEWLDIKSSDYGPQLVIALNSGQRIHVTQASLDVSQLRAICNALWGLFGDKQKNFETNRKQSLELVYQISADKQRKRKDGTPKIWYNLFFKWVMPMHDHAEWRDFSQKYGLEWTITHDANGNPSYNSDAEMIFWQKFVKAIQVNLINCGDVMPLNFNSIFFGDGPAPGAGKHDDATQAAARSRYDAFKNVHFWRGQGAGISADDALNGSSPAKPDYDSAPEPMYSNYMPSEENANTNQYAGVLENVPGNESDDLPF